MAKKQDELKRLEKQAQTAHKPVGANLSKIVQDYENGSLKERKVSKSVYVTESLWMEAQKEFGGVVSDLVEAALRDALELRKALKEKKEPPTS